MNIFKLYRDKKDPLKVQDGSMDFHVTEYKKVIDTVFRFSIVAYLQETTTR